MGSTFIIVAAVALGTGLVCLLCGYLWGRSNVRSQIADALDKARISADAREFSIREELDEKMLELTDLRKRVDEIPRLHQQIEQLQSERMRGPAGNKATSFATEDGDSPEEILPEKARQKAPPPDSTEKTIQNLLKSIEERMKHAEEDSPIDIQASETPQPARFAVEIPPTITQLSAKPAPPEMPAAKPAAASAKDEWQEFAASLAALRNRKK
jgi:hypothetical protein